MLLHINMQHASASIVTHQHMPCFKKMFWHATDRDVSTCDTCWQINKQYALTSIITWVFLNASACNMLWYMAALDSSACFWHMLTCNMFWYTLVCVNMWRFDALKHTDMNLHLYTSTHVDMWHAVIYTRFTCGVTEHVLAHISSNTQRADMGQWVSVDSDTIQGPDAVTTRKMNCGDLHWCVSHALLTCIDTSYLVWQLIMCQRASLACARAHHMWTYWNISQGHAVHVNMLHESTRRTYGHMHATCLIPC